jgi:hypothetical protein
MLWAAACGEIVNMNGASTMLGGELATISLIVGINHDGDNSILTGHGWGNGSSESTCGRCNEPGSCWCSELCSLYGILIWGIFSSNNCIWDSPEILESLIETLNGFDADGFGLDPASFGWMVLVDVEFWVLNWGCFSLDEVAADFWADIGEEPLSLRSEWADDGGVGWSSDWFVLVLTKDEKFWNDATGFVLAIVLKLCKDDLDVESTGGEGMGLEVVESLLMWMSDAENGKLTDNCFD